MIVNTAEVQIVEPEKNAKLEDKIFNQSVYELSIICHFEEIEIVVDCN
jgi:hypothetical protein